MARKFIYPDPKDRTINSPMALIQPAQILGLYNQENNDIGWAVGCIDSSVKNWYIGKMKEHGWGSVEFIGHQCLLKVDISIANPTTAG